MKTIIIVQPEIPENTGFIARLCENFGYDLRLVDPEFNLEEARKTASKAQKKLEGARIYDDVEDSVKDLDYVVGTKPEKGNTLHDFQPRENTSIMIGRESSGLTNEELELCDSVVHIETNDYSSINQSHAAAILMHSMNTRENETANLQQLKAVEEETGEKTIQLLKRSSPTSEELNAVIGEIKDMKQF